MYSGPVAAYAYNVARRHQHSALVLVGPSHFVPFEGVSIWPDGEWETPLGPVKVDRDLAQRGAPLRRRRSSICLPPTGASIRLEMQMPFIAHLLPDVPIVPMVMGHQTRETAFALGDAPSRRPSRRMHPTRLLVASSDLSHYEDADTAAALDRRVIEHVERLDADGLMRALDVEPRHACGGGPMVAVLDAARRLGARHARLLQYADSGDVSGDKSSVGWLHGSGDMVISPEDQPRLIALARRALEARVRHAALPDIESTLAPDVLCGAFVSIFHDGELRGCLGRLNSPLP